MSFRIPVMIGGRPGLGVDFSNANSVERLHEALSCYPAFGHPIAMNTRKSRYRRHRFPPEIISSSMLLYHRFSLSFRDIEDLLAKRGIVVSYESIRRWCLKFGPRYQRSLFYWR